jgi:hypothetical protein
MPGDQDQSIKDRRKLLFDEEELLAKPDTNASVVRKPFRTYLAETPAAPTSAGMNWLVWGAVAIVALLFAASIWKSQQPRNERRRSRASESRAYTTPASRELTITAGGAGLLALRAGHDAFFYYNMR